MNVKRFTLDCHKPERFLPGVVIDILASFELDQEALPLVRVRIAASNMKAVYIDRIVISDFEHDLEWPIQTYISTDVSPRSHKIVSLPSEDKYKEVRGFFRMEKSVSLVRIEVYYSPQICCYD